MCLGAMPPPGGLGDAVIGHCNSLAAQQNSAIAHHRATMNQRRQALLWPGEIKELEKAASKSLWPVMVTYTNQDGLDRVTAVFSHDEMDRVKDKARWRAYLGEDWHIDKAEAEITMRALED